MCSMSVLYCAFFFLKLQCVECFSLLLEWYVRESQDAKYPAIFDGFSSLPRKPSKMHSMLS